jgi:REP element-mobilizing transposase RayT
MFYRRKLPHWLPEVSEEAFLFITWRLAGSLPWGRRFGLPSGAGASACQVGQALSPGKSFIAFDRETDKAAFGPVWLRDPRIATMVAETLQHGESEMEFYRLRAWVIMPNHVHLLMLPKQPLPVIMRWLKGSTARKANLILSRSGETFWQDESFDHRVRDQAELDWLVHYVEHNPVTAGLIANPAVWPWSSAGWEVKTRVSLAQEA